MEFFNKHPGGQKVLEKYKDKDITKAFENIKHSYYAHELLDKYKLNRTEEQKKEKRKILTLEHIRQKLFGSLSFSVLSTDIYMF